MFFFIVSVFYRRIIFIIICTIIYDMSKEPKNATV